MRPTRQGRTKLEDSEEATTARAVLVLAEECRDMLASVKRVHAVVGSLAKRYNAEAVEEAA